MNWYLVGVHMIRTITIASVFLLATSSIVHAEDTASSLPNLRYKHRHLQNTDMNMSIQEYEETYRRNRKFVSKTLRSYSNNALKIIGMPEQGIKLIGSAVGLATKGAKLNLNKSKTLSLKLNDIDDPDRTSLYLGVKLDW